MKVCSKTFSVLIYPSPIGEIEKSVTYQNIHKGEVFVEKGHGNHSEYFVIEGICRSFLISPSGEEITISFFTENSVISPFTTRTRFGKSLLNMEALTPLHVGVIDASIFEDLMVNNLEVREFGNAVLRNELAEKVNKEIGMASASAAERLVAFRKRYPLLENLVPHTTIASFLGITNISLSRLRRELL